MNHLHQPYLLRADHEPPPPPLHIIYQTWITANVPNDVNKLRQYMKQINPQYKIYLYTDDDIADFIKTYNVDEFDNNVLWEVYCRLDIGAMKADFWRYLILYKYGGVYLDMDSLIIKPLDMLFAEICQKYNISRRDIGAIITRENNENIICNWILIFRRNHKLLKAIINYIIDIILNTNYNLADILYITGPRALTYNIYLYFSGINAPHGGKSIYEFFNNIDKYSPNVFKETDEWVSGTSNYDIIMYKTDMGDYARFKHRYANLLYVNVKHWTETITEVT